MITEGTIKWCPIKVPTVLFSNGIPIEGYLRIGAALPILYYFIKIKLPTFLRII